MMLSHPASRNAHVAINSGSAAVCSLSPRLCPWSPIRSLGGGRLEAPDMVDVVLRSRVHDNGCCLAEYEVLQ